MGERDRIPPWSKGQAGLLPVRKDRAFQSPWSLPRSAAHGVHVGISLGPFMPPSWYLGTGEPDAARLILMLLAMTRIIKSLFS